MCLQVSEEKRASIQEELAANRTHQTTLEAQVQDLKKVRASQEDELHSRDRRLQQQDESLQELQQQQVTRPTDAGVFSVVQVL